MTKNIEGKKMIILYIIVINILQRLIVTDFQKKEISLKLLNVFRETIILKKKKNI